MHEGRGQEEYALWPELMLGDGSLDGSGRSSPAQGRRAATVRYAPSGGFGRTSSKPARSSEADCPVRTEQVSEATGAIPVDSSISPNARIATPIL